MAKDQHRDPMGNVDKAWLEMDRETNLMVINGVMLFDELIDYERFKMVFQQRLVGQYERFRQRIIESPANSGHLLWEADPYFDIRSHVRRIALPAPCDTATLQDLMSDLMNGALDRSKPLWRVYLIENYNGGCAVFARFHHCIADGIALIRVMLSLTDTNAEAKPSVVPALPPDDSWGFAPLRSVFGLAQSATHTVGRVAQLAVREGKRTFQDPASVLEAAKSAGILTAASAAILSRLLIIPVDRPSVFNGELGAVKRIVWSDPVDLEKIKAIGKAVGATVNDVLIAALAGSLRNYMEHCGENPNTGDIRAMVPVNLRPLEGDIELGNQFGLVYLTLPVSLPDPLDRLHEVKRRMDVLKSSPEALVVYQVLNVLGRLPGELIDVAIDLFSSKATAVLTNVPGPREVLYFAGKPMRRVMFWVPQSGRIGLGISIISYAGAVTLGIVIDEKLVADPQVVVEGFQDELDALARLAAVGAAAHGQGAP